MTATLNGGSDPVGRVTVAKCTALLTVEWDRAGTVVVTHPETAATSSHSFFDKRTPEKFHHFPSSSGNRHFLKNRADAVKHFCQKFSSHNTLSMKRPADVSSQNVQTTKSQYSTSQVNSCV